ncbi:MAG TPA: glycosyltransferase [Solirubrobacterales bacterium]|jgi:GT2 family glycosyltransferase|nr:glycosyltransferase [Solirubrobacterales bacterium]
MSPGTATTPIDVVIVNWNTAEAAIEAAGAYLRSDSVEARVTVADNASQPEQRRLLEEGCPEDARLVPHGENLGYGRAANLALGDGIADMVCVSNADVLPEPGALATLAAVVRAEARAGMVGPAFGGKTDRYHSRLPTGLTMLGRIFAGTFSRGPVPPPLPGEVKAVGQPSGACFLMRRDTWELLGGFDDGFFLWYEDVDLAKRLHDKGYRNLVVGSARVGHVGAGSFAQVDRPRQRAIRLASVERYIDKHHPRLSTFTPVLLRLSRRLRATAPMTPGQHPGAHGE